mgnify:CR=1 FL=1
MPVPSPITSVARGVPLCTISGSSAYGVYVGGASTGTRVAGNTIDGAGAGSYGLFVDGATGAVLGDVAAGLEAVVQEHPGQGSGEKRRQVGTLSRTDAEGVEQPHHAARGQHADQGSDEMNTA